MTPTKLHCKQRAEAGDADKTLDQPPPLAFRPLSPQFLYTSFPNDISLCKVLHYNLFCPREWFIIASVTSRT